MVEKIQIITRDSLPNAATGSGGGLRAWSIGEALAAAGYSIRYTVVDKTIYPDHIDETIRSEEPDAVLFEQWHLASLSSYHKPLRIVDLHGSLLLENAFRNHGEPASSMEAKINALASCDLIMCAGERQKAYFMSWCIAAGHNPASFSVIDVPVFIWGNPRERMTGPAAGHERHYNSSGISYDPEQPLFVFSGRLWPWINPFPGLNRLAQLLEETGRGKLIIRAAAPERVDELTGQDLSSEYRGSIDLLRDYSAVDVQPFGDRDSLLYLMTHAHAAYDLYQDNPERWLAFSTRTCEFLWAGLPVIHSSASPLADMIRAYDAGWVLDPGDISGLELVIRSILNGDADINALSQGARALSKSCLSAERCVQPVLHWLKNPVRNRPKLTLLDKTGERLVAETLKKNRCLEEENNLVRQRLALMRTSLFEARRRLISTKPSAGSPILFRACRFLYLFLKRTLFDYPMLLLLAYIHRKTFDVKRDRICAAPPCHKDGGTV